MSPEAIHGVDEKKLTHRVPIMPIGIGRAGAEHLDDFALRVVAPQRAPQRHARVIRCAGRADFPDTGGSAPAVKPAVGTEAKSVRDGVMVLGRDVETIEHDLGRAVRHAVAVAIRKEQELRRAHRPDAAMPDFNAGEPLQVLREDPARAEAAVAVRALENHDAIAQPEIVLQGVFRVGVILGDRETRKRIPPSGPAG
ncbi:MAG: hypothetical protein HY736_16675 [Verrucomicrobia bacterium]|nr:hypothetical protein [Verrucomicrobiota bacterium]